jgi:phosphonopyruvate decarboxylase
MTDATPSSTTSSPPLVSGAAFAGRLHEQGFDFFAGVPCSLIEDVLAALVQSPRERPYVASVREDLACGLAGGAWLAGRRPALLIQNSGLGTAFNALASFTLMYGLPVLLLVTWRGYLGKDAPEHILTGAITPRLLELLGIPHRVLDRASTVDDLAWAAREMDARRGPVALLVPPDVLATGEAAHARPTDATATGGGGRPEPPAGYHARALSPTISRGDAIAVAVKALGDEPVVHANGYVCRESFAVADRPQNFYMIGSMGLAASIGLGIALARPGLRPVIFDGDGNVLMSLGILAMVAGLAPPNFVHLVFDNEVYGSTGNQPSPSRQVRLDRLAAAAGYRRVDAVDTAGDLAAALRRALAGDGPHFVLAKVTAEEAAVPRIPHTPHAIRDRFRTALGAP